MAPPFNTELFQGINHYTEAAFERSLIRKSQDRVIF